MVLWFVDGSTSIKNSVQKDWILKSTKHWIESDMHYSLFHEFAKGIAVIREFL